MDTTTELESLIKNFKSIQRAKRYQKKLEQRLAFEENRLVELEQALDREYEDVEAFETLNLTNLFYRFLGTKAEQYELEKQEYLHAVLQLRECKKSIALYLIRWK